MALLIDAYNVLHCTHILPAPYAMMNVERLCDLLADSRWSCSRIAVVCDGAPPSMGATLHGEVDLVYAGGGKDADSWIERFIARTTAPRDLMVVSNDNRIIRAARRRRCRTMDSESFLRQLIRKPQTPRPDKPASAGPEETRQWMHKFGYDVPPDQPDHPPTASPPALDRPEDGADYWLKEFGFEAEDESPG